MKPVLNSKSLNFNSLNFHFNENHRSTNRKTYGLSVENDLILNDKMQKVEI